MKKRVFLSKNAAQTQRLAEVIAKMILDKNNSKAAKILALKGELGSGKTTFIQGLAKSLGIKEKVTSPSFVLIKKYGDWSLGQGRSLVKTGTLKNFYHIDCYRLDNPGELIDLGFKEIISNPENLVAIEWADKIESLIPEGAIWINFKWEGEKE